MIGTLPSSRTLSLLLAVLLHVALASVAATTSIDASKSGRDQSRSRGGGAIVQLVPWDETEPAQPPPSESLSDRQPPPPQPKPVERPEEVALGIEDGADQATPNWVGFKEATEHHARKSEVAQPQLDPDAGAASPASAPTEITPPGVPLTEGAPGLRGPPGERQPPSPVPTPSPESTSAPPITNELATQGPTSPPPADQRAPADPPRPEAAASDADQAAREALESLFDPELAKLPEFIAKPTSAPSPVSASAQDASASDQPTRPAQAPSATPAPMPPPPAAPSGAGGQGGEGGQGARKSGAPSPPQSQPGTAVSPAAAEKSGNPGEQSPKQVDASSLEDSTQVRPGRPIAAKGLEITTRRPQFSKITRVVAAPENPVLEAKFVRDGTVRTVKIIKSSGYPDVDQPVIDAVYAWTAKGEALRRLPASTSTLLHEDGEPGVTIKFTIILR